MAADFFQIAFGGFLASVVWFLVTGFFYLNPLFMKMHKKFEKSPWIKQWGSPKLFLIYMYILILVECLIFAFIYSYIKPAFPKSTILSGMIFGLMLIVINLIPNLSSRWVMSNYPDKLFFTDLVSGIIGSFVIGLTLVFVI